MPDQVHDSHYPNAPATAPLKGEPLRQRFRNAIGEKVDGVTNPNGVEVGDHKNLVGNNQGKTY